MTYIYIYILFHAMLFQATRAPFSLTVQGGFFASFFDHDMFLRNGWISSIRLGTRFLSKLEAMC